MKLLFIFTFIGISATCISQNKYDTKIEKANKVEINGGKAEIKNAEKVTIGTIIIVSGAKPRYYFSEMTRKREGNGIYVTTINLKHSGDPESIYLNLGVEFDKPVESVELNGYIGMGISESFGDNKLWYTFKGSVQSQEKSIDLIIRSKEPVFIKLSGVDSSN